MACNCNDTTSNTCTCVTNYNAKCVIYRGATTCSDLVTTGDTLEEAVQALATAICEGIPSPSGETVVVDNVDGETTVSSSTVGSTTTYTVGLDDDITDQIDENTEAIAELQDCCENSIWTLVSGTEGLSVSETGDHEWTITYSPSGECDCGGMFLNDTTGYSPNGSGGSQTVFTSTENLTNYNLTTADRIIYMLEGMQGGNPIDNVQIELLNGATQKFIIQNSAGNEGYKNGFVVQITITPTNVGSGNAKVTATWLYNSVANGADDTGGTGYRKSVFQKTVTGLDFSALKIQVTFVNDSLQGSSYNILNLASGELTKGI